jgi:hypothetical protein
MNPATITRLFIAAALAALLLPSQLLAQGVEYIESHYTKTECQIPMRDGVRLFTAIYAPKDASSTYPILLVRTQSGIRPYGADQYPRELGPSPIFAKEGYIFVYQDIRGRFMSEGNYINMRPHIPAKKSPQDTDESSDAWDTVDWLEKHVPNHNGKVGLFGTSLRGFTATAGMLDAHPAVKAGSPGAPVVDWFTGDDWHHNGALILTHAFNYIPYVGRARAMPNKTPYVLFDYGTPDGYEFFMRLGPLANADARYFKGTVPFWNELMQHGTYDEFWKSHNVSPHLKNIRPAMLLMGGWFDAENLYGVLETHRRMEAASRDTKETFVMGPWIHGGWMGQSDGSSLGDISFKGKTAEYFREKIELPFFEFHLKGKGEFNFPRAWMFETGTNQWRGYSSWPPKNVRPFSLYFQSQGRLAFDPPMDDGDAAYDEFISDPAKPVPYIDKIAPRLATEYPTADQRFAARRPDVLVYQTSALAEDVTLAGPISAELHVSTTGTDSDWIVKLIDVYPDDYPDPNPSPLPPSNANPPGIRMGGYQQLVRGDVMRGKFRNSLEKPEPFAPGKPTAVQFRLNDVNHVFRSGHKIMVQVQSTWFPLVDRNPQTFVDIYSAKESDFIKATQRVYRSKSLPSRIVGERLP